MCKFEEVPIGEVFHCNGNTYRKRSTRTADLIGPVHLTGRWFYFGLNEIVTR